MMISKLLWQTGNYKSLTCFLFVNMSRNFPFQCVQAYFLNFGCMLQSSGEI